MRSSVPAFKAALLVRLLADEGLVSEALSVSIGNPHPNRPTRELVVIGDTSGRGVAYRGAESSGRETYSVGVLASIIGPVQASHADQLVRAYDIAEAITANILGWRLTNYDGVVDIIGEGEGSDDEAVDDQVRESSVTLLFHVTASI